MSNVIDFEAARQAREPHMTGPARCLDCKHEWEASAPVGTVWLECPACSLERGRFALRVQRSDELHAVCFCGNDLFHVTPSGPYCPNCGEWWEEPTDE